MDRVGRDRQVTKSALLDRHQKAVTHVERVSHRRHRIHLYSARDPGSCPRTTMTGPPTPPITSAIEIEDLARAENAEDTNQASGSAPAAPQPVEVATPLPAEVLTTTKDPNA